MKPTHSKILSAWEMFEEAEPDISTERLIQQVADHCKCDPDDVVESLYRTRNQRETK